MKAESEMNSIVPITSGLLSCSYYLDNRAKQLELAAAYLEEKGCQGLPMAETKKQRAEELRSWAELIRAKYREEEIAGQKAKGS